MPLDLPKGGASRNTLVLLHIQDWRGPRNFMIYQFTVATIILLAKSEYICIDIAALIEFGIQKLCGKAHTSLLTWNVFLSKNNSAALGVTDLKNLLVDQGRQGLEKKRIIIHGDICKILCLTTPYDADLKFLSSLLELTKVEPASGAKINITAIHFLIVRSSRSLQPLKNYLVSNGVIVGS